MVRGGSVVTSAITRIVGEGGIVPSLNVTEGKRSRRHNGIRRLQREKRGTMQKPRSCHAHRFSPCLLARRGYSVSGVGEAPTEGSPPMDSLALRCFIRL